MKTRFMKLVTVMAMILSFIGFSFAEKPANPTFTPNRGEVEADAAITIAGPDGATIFYAFATEKTGEGVAYEEYNAENKPTVTAEHLTIWAYARTGEAEPYAYSDTVNATYTIKAAATFVVEPTLVLKKTDMQTWKPVWDTLQLTKDGTNYSAEVVMDIMAPAMLKLACTPETEETAIYYTNDKSDPTASSYKYAELLEENEGPGGIALSDAAEVLSEEDGSMKATIKAIAIKGEESSAIITVAVTLTQPPVPTAPAIMPIVKDADDEQLDYTKNGAPAMYNGDGDDVYVVENVPATGAWITMEDANSFTEECFYTTDGTDPSESSTRFDLEDYNAKIDVVFAEGSDEFVLKVYAVNPDETEDNTSIMTLTCKKEAVPEPTRPDAPSFSKAAGELHSGDTVIVFFDATQADSMFVANSATAEFVKYTKNDTIIITNDTTIRAFAVKAGLHSDTATREYTKVPEKVPFTPVLADAYGPLELTYANGKYTAKQVDTTGATLSFTCAAGVTVTYTVDESTEVKTYTEAIKLVDLFGTKEAVTVTATAKQTGELDSTIVIELKARELTADFMLAYMYWNWPYEATPEDWTADEKGFYNSTIYAIEDPAPALLFECSPKKVGNTVKVHYAFDKAATAADATMKEDFFSGKFKLNLAFAEGKDTIELHVLVAEYEAAADPEAKEDASPVVTLAMKFKFAKNANALVLNTAVYDRYGYQIPQSTWKKDGNPFFPLGDLDEMGDGTGVFEHDSIMNGWFLGINPVGVLTTDTTTYRAFYTTDGSEPAETSTEVELEECSVFRIPAVFGSADQVTYKVLVQEIVGECESSIGPRVGEGTEPDADAEVKVVSFSKMTFTLKKTQEILSFAPEMTSGTMVPFNEKDKKFQIAALTTDSLKLICLGSEKITYKVGAAEAVDYTKPLAVKDLLNGARNVTITAKATNETSGALAAENVIELSQKQVSLSLSLQNGWVPIKITYADGKYSAKDVPDEATLRVSPSPYQSTVTYTLNEETKKDTVKGNLKAADLFGTKDTVTINFKASCEGAIDTAIVVQLIKKPVLLTLTPVVKNGETEVDLSYYPAEEGYYAIYSGDVSKEDLTVALTCNLSGEAIYTYALRRYDPDDNDISLNQTYSGPIEVTEDMFDANGEFNMTAAVKLGAKTDTIRIRLTLQPELPSFEIMAGLTHNEVTMRNWVKNGNPSSEVMGNWALPCMLGGDGTGIYAYDTIPENTRLMLALVDIYMTGEIYYTLDGSEADAETGTKYNYDPISGTNEGMLLTFPTGKDTLFVNVMAFNATDDYATATFTFTKKKAEAVVVAKPTINPNGGEVAAGTKVTLACTTTGSTIYYTTNGDEPTNASTRYTDGVTVDKAMTIKAIAYVGESKSEVASAAFTIKATTVEVAKPTFNPAAGAVVAGTKVEIKCTTTGSKIYYTTDGTTPTDKSTEYKEAITIDKAMTIKAIAYVGEDKSEVAEAAYTIKVGIEGKELAGVSVYPNPNDGEFYVTVPVNATVEVFAVNGKQVANMTVSAGKSLVRLNNAGIYFVRVRANGQDAIRKVVVR